jgi:transglutaminase-like putative cysteine protease
VSLFYWVRDNIEYELGLKSDTASSTLLRGSGSCINKANLVVALLRALGIPAGFHIMTVKTRAYFSCLCTPCFNKFMSEPVSFRR